MNQAKKVSSMTGFASVHSTTRAGTLTLELRSVNSRFLDLNFRMNDDLRMAEPVIRERLNNGLARGKVECRISWGRNTESQSVPNVNLDLVRKLADLESHLQAAMPQLTTFRTTEVLNWPGVVEDNSLSSEELLAEIAKLCDEALTQLQQAREREGANLVTVLLEKIAGMEAIVGELEPQIPQFIAAYEAKIRDRITDSLDKVLADKSTGLTVQDVEERIKHEVTLYSVRVDVTEELDRLKAHFKEIKRILKQGGVTGKRLDFVTQELNREANTLGSKANAFAQTQSSIDLKVLIEQFREQVQNIE